MEYENWAPRSSLASCNNGASCYETSAKRLAIYIYTIPNQMIKLINQWKTIPSVKSFDNIGIVYENFNLTSATGRQCYNTATNTSSQCIDYGWNGNNMSVRTENDGQKGISISQNIINSVYNYLQNELTVYGTGNDGWFADLKVAGSYQHAVTDIDLATAKNFKFDGWGMGKVYNWNTSWNKWDNMQGVCLNWSGYLWTC